MPYVVVGYVAFNRSPNRCAPGLGVGSYEFAGMYFASASMPAGSPVGVAGLAVPAGDVASAAKAVAGAAVPTRTAAIVTASRRERARRRTDARRGRRMRVSPVREWGRAPTRRGHPGSDARALQPGRLHGSHPV